MTNPTAIADAFSAAIVLLIGGFSIWMSFWERLPIGGKQEEGRK